MLLFAGIRFTIAGGGLLLTGKNLRREIRQTPWLLLLGFAATQTFLQYFLFYQAIAISSASLAALLTATGGFWWMILSPIALKTPWPSAAQWFSILLGAIGVIIAVYKPGSGEGSPVYGGILMLAATASGALALMFFAKIKAHMSAKNATGISLLAGGLALLALGASAFPAFLEGISSTVIIATLWLATVSAVAFSIWNQLSIVISPTKLANYRFLIPICGIFEAIVFLKDETLGWSLVLGTVLVIGSAMLARRFTETPRT